jgi:alanine racemase
MSTNSDPLARAWVDIDLRALVTNARTIATRSGARLLPMIKSNGYGLGAIPVARALESLEPWGYGVSTISEGAALREAGITRPLLVFTPIQPSQILGYRSHQLRAVIGDAAALAAWVEAAGGPFHIEVDTGMSRAGIRWDDAAAWQLVYRTLDGAAGWEGAFTHFHSAESNPSATALQWQRFQAVIAALPRRPELVHAANSAAALQGSGYAADLVRPGIFLYGGEAGGPRPETVARLRGRVVARRLVRAGDTVSYGATWTAERDTTVATVALGYADGMPRALGNRGAIELAGERVPIVGRVTMDMLMVAVSAPVNPGDVATAYGGLVSLDAAAAAAATISYELLTSIGARVERRYTG